MQIVHNNKKLITTVECENTKIATPHIVFEGTKEECEKEIERLNLSTKEIERLNLSTGELK